MANCFGPPEANRQSLSGYGLPVAAALAHPVGDLLGGACGLGPERGQVLAHIAEDGPEPLGVELHRVASVCADVRLLVTGPVAAMVDTTLTTPTAIPR